MKPLLLFLALFAAVGYFFGEEELRTYRTEAAISRNPAFAPATVEGVSKVGRKKLVSYIVSYRYEVDGSTYRVSTTATDEAGAARYLADPNPQVAFSRQKPSVATLKRYYDLRHTRGAPFQALVVVAVLAAGIALPLSLLVGWRLGWLKRQGG